MENVEKIRKLADALRTKEARENWSKTDVSGLKIELGGLSMCSSTVKEEELIPIYQIFRCLSNSCVQSNKNQNLILECGIMDSFVNTMEFILNPGISNNVPKASLEKIELIALHFLGNLVVNNKEAQDVVWKYGFPYLFFNMLSNADEKRKDIVCMVVYNCLLKRKKLFNNENEFWLLSSIIDYCRIYQGAEWALFIVELLFTSSSFISFYKQTLDLRSYLLEFISAWISNNHTNCSGNNVEKNLEFLCDQFSTKSKCIMMLANNVSSANLDELQEESHTLITLLSMLCNATCVVEKYRKVRNSESLIKTLIELLGQRQSLKSKDDNGTNDTTNSGGSVSSPDDPSIGFERDLVRVIGNMCYRNKNIQDMTRELGGIEMLLNACSIDDTNPYIMQWAIFAIRNLCEENSQNQTYIGNLERQDLALSKMLSETKIEARLEEGKIRIGNCDRSKIS